MDNKKLNLENEDLELKDKSNDNGLLSDKSLDAVNGGSNIYHNGAKPNGGKEIDKH